MYNFSSLIVEADSSYLTATEMMLFMPEAEKQVSLTQLTVPIPALERSQCRNEEHVHISLITSSPEKALLVFSNFSLHYSSINRSFLQHRSQCSPFNSSCHT